MDRPDYRTTLCRYFEEEIEGEGYFLELADRATGHEAEKLRLLVAATPFPGPGSVTVSIGAAELAPDEELDAWIERADRAMYEAKAAGRNAVRAARPA